MSVVNDESMLDILIDDVQLTLSLSDNTEKQTLFKNVLYCRKAFCNLFSIDCAVLNNVEFKINKKSINFINENDNFIDWTDFKNCYFYLHVNKLMSSTSINLIFMTKTWFISAKLENAELENAKSVKDNMTDQQQNSDHYRFFDILTWFLFISNEINIIKLIIWELIVKKSIIKKSFTVYVIKNCFMLILFTILIALTVRLIISELVILIIMIFLLLIESLFDCLHDIYFLHYWIRVHSCFFSSECSLKFFKLENIVIVSIVFDFLHKSRSSNIIFEWEFFD